VVTSKVRQLPGPGASANRRPGFENAKLADSALAVRKKSRRFIYSPRSFTLVAVVSGLSSRPMTKYTSLRTRANDAKRESSAQQLASQAELKIF
jgi:hypothetical protein